MNENYLLQNETAKELYKKTSDMPIIDYHCHLSPQEIYENKVFDNIGQIWLSGDHYKWRLMRTAGIDEHYITGNASYYEKFLKYAQSLEFAAGNPLYHWSHMELSMYFGIDEPLKASSAGQIWNAASSAIKERRICPRQLIEKSKTELICTTDDITDSLIWHKKIREDKTISTKVLPSFRTDNLLLMYRYDYKEYIAKLSDITGIEIKDMHTLQKALENRIAYFKAEGCVFTDVGIPFFPDRISEFEKADETFKIFLKGEKADFDSYIGLIGYLYMWLGSQYKKNGLVMQWHMAVYRNANTNLFKKCGADCGADCVGNQLNGESLIYMLDALNSSNALPRTVLYTLNGANMAQIASIAGSFPGVQCGAAWWFCDHKRGICDAIETIAENSCLGSFLGMLTDSRSFLSYARHDYFRRILSSIVGSWVEKGEFDRESAEELIKKINYKNIKELVGN